MLHPTDPRRPDMAAAGAEASPVRRIRHSGAASPRPAKARCAADCEQLEQLPNIGPALAADLRLIDIAAPHQLVGRDGFELYQRLCRATGRRQDPCVLDTFLAIIDFMHGAAPAPWWRYTAERKQRFGQV